MKAPLIVPEISPMTLRDYQEDVSQKLREAFWRVRSVILQMATGSGKTAVAAAIAEGLAARGKTMLALVHRRELVDQFANTLDRVGLKGRYGIIASGRAPTPWAKFQVASIQTLYRRQIDLNPRYVVVDECRHAKAKTWEEVLGRFPESKILGLDATPVRLDGKPLGDHFDEIVPGPSIEWLVAHGWLAPITLKYVPRGVTTKGIRTVAGDYSRKQLGERINSRVIAAPVYAFFKYASDRRVIFFAINRQDSKAVAEKLRDQGIRAAHVDAKTPAGVREQIIGEFRDGSIQVLCNVDIVGEGFDAPMCDCVMMGLPTQSLSRYLQMAGRCVRPDHGRDGLVIDLCENFWRPGFGRPDLEREWYLHLDGTHRTASEITTRIISQKVCVMCATVYPATSGACPSCGHEKVLDVPKHLDMDLIGDELGGIVAKPTTVMSGVRTEMRALIRNGGDRATVREIRQKYGLNARWEQNAISALNL